MKLRTAMISSAFILVLMFSASAMSEELPKYKKTSGISGNINSVGSDTLANLMTLWAEEYKRLYPSVSIQVQAAGSSTAPPALTEGTSNFGPMSRKMKNKEITAFEKKHGYKPTAIPVAIDAIAIYVHKDNPIDGLSIEQVDAIFSSTRKCGATNDIAKWGDVGMTGAWVGRDIQMYGRNSVSGTYGYFKSAALCKGDYKNTVNEQPGSASVVQSVTASLNGIGYSGIGYRTAGVRLIPISKKKSNKYYDPTPENALSGKYPVSRFLYVYVNKHPNKKMPPLEREFIKMIMSQRGQNVVKKEGFVPLTKKLVEKFSKDI